jgi:hypothetical protein
MVLSGYGDQVMTKLSDTQAVILSTASQREDGAVLPLPKTLKSRTALWTRSWAASRPRA